MYPKEIIDLIRSRHPTWIDGSRIDHHPLGFSFSPDTEASFAVEDFLLQNETTVPAISAYLGYMRKMRDGFRRVSEHCGYFNENSSHSLGHDKWSIGWSGDFLLPMASYLYTLKSYGIEGDVLECGAFKGSSTACLSQACEHLGVRLFCADSFEGLPADEGHYGKGDFFGSLEEVKKNVAAHGFLDSVTFIKGWYSESLKGFDKPICLLWVDVDLQQSTLDLLGNVFPVFNQDGVIFTDGCPTDPNIKDGKFVLTGGEPGGFHIFLRDAQIDYEVAETHARGIAMVRFDPALRTGLRLFPQRLRYLIEKI